MDRVRVGVVGMGGMGQAHSKILQNTEGAQLTCICDVEREVVETQAKNFGVPGFVEHKELIGSGLVDAIIIATPHWQHPQIAVDAFQAGLHVLTEKPIAVRVSDADLMLKAARKAKKVFSVMYQRRTEPAVIKALEIIRGGLIGEIQRTLCVEPWYRAQAYYESGTWRATWTGEGGGVLINQAPHGMDLFVLLGGLPSRIEAKTRTRLHKIEVEDEACAFLEYPNGAWGYYYVTTCEPVGPAQMEFAGDKGKLVIRGGGLELYRYSEPLSKFTFAAGDMWASLDVKTEPVEVPSGQPAGHAGIIKNFIRAILYKEPLISPGVEGIKSVEFLNALILSGQTGKPVKIPVSRKKYDRLMEELKSQSRPKEHLKIQRATDPKFAR